MDIGRFSCDKALKTALKDAGFSIEEIKKQGQKTVITVSRYKEPNKRKAPQTRNKRETNA